MRMSLDEQVEFILRAAEEEAIKHHHYYLTAEHVFYVTLHLNPIKRIFISLDTDVDVLKTEIEYFFSTIRVLDLSQKPVIIKKDESYIQLVESAYHYAAHDERNVVEIRDLLLGFLDIDQRKKTSFSYTKHINVKKLSSILRYNNDKDNTHSDLEVEFLSEYSDDSAYDYSEDGTEQVDEEKIFLSKLTTNLCDSASQNPFDTFIGQEDMMSNIYEALMRRKKNNVILVGDPGVGKTAIVYEFANRLAKGQVPFPLQHNVLLSLNVMSLVAGTRYRGDFEERVKQLIDSLSDQKNNILFLDDIHSILSAGASSGNSNDFGDLIKPLLVDNTVRCIGATTYEEFKHFEKDKTLLRRFNIVDIHAPSLDEVFRILKEVKPRYEEFYNLHYSDKVLEHIIQLSHTHIHERAFPDKAIDILDSVGSRIRVKDFSSKPGQVQDTPNEHDELYEVKTDDIGEIVSRISKRPIANIQKDELANLSSLEKRLQKKIVGQNNAIKVLVNTIIRARTGLRQEEKPIASLLFVGPTGVGKTELTKQLALELGMNFQRYDMSEYQERHSVAKFIGSPPGYVGHEQGGILIETIRRTPHLVLLLDEIEKAHTDVFNLLLQIMDYATITDSSGQKANFSHAVIIMTSNAGAQEAEKNSVGFEHSTLKGNAEIRNAITHLFSPEFRNRLDNTIVFDHLTRKHMRYIVIQEMRKIKSMLLKKRIKISWSTGVVSYLIHRGFDPLYGARSVLRTIENEIKGALSEEIVRRHNELADKKSLFLSLTLNKAFSLKNITLDSYIIEIKNNNPIKEKEIVL